MVAAVAVAAFLAFGAGHPPGTTVTSPLTGRTITLPTLPEPWNRVDAWLRERLGLPESPDGRVPNTMACHRLPELRTAADFNTLVATVRNQPAFMGGDVGVDVELHDGRRLWLFGDTLRDPSYDPPLLVRNSMLVFDPECSGVVVTAEHGAVIPDREDGVGYWPMSAGVITGPGYDVVGVAAQRVRATGEGVWDFEVIGPSLAVFIVASGGVPQLASVTDLGPDSPDRSLPMWGAATAVSGSWVYIYGTAKPRGTATFGSSLHLARAEVGDLIHPEDWQYWTGHGWGRQGDPLGTLIEAQGGVSQVLSVFPRNGRWYAVSKRDDALGTDLVVWTAPRPTGPFVAGEPVAKIPTNGRTGLLRYMPLAHPGLETAPGTVLVSYSRNVEDPERLLRDPFLYRPVFLEIPLSD